jgi:hypothetical protein
MLGPPIDTADAPEAGRWTDPPHPDQPATSAAPAPTRRDPWTVVAAITTGVVLVLLVASLDVILASLRANADFIAPVALSEYAAQYSDARIMTGNYGWWAGLWLLQLLEPLPGNTYLAQFLPLAVTGLVTVGVAVQARRLWGVRGGWIVVLVALSVGLNAWVTSASWAARAPTWWTTALLGLVVVAAAGRPAPGIRRWVLVVGSVAAVAAVLAVGSGDAMVLVALGAVAVTGLVALRTDRALGATLIVAAIGLAGLTVVARDLIAAAG